jgi:hypothetical protein
MHDLNQRMPESTGGRWNDPRSTRAKGRAVALANRRELGKGVRERFAEKLDKEADGLFQSFKSAWQRGDYRAAEAVLNQAFGRPAAEGEEQGSGGVTIHIESAFFAKPGNEGSDAA